MDGTNSHSADDAALGFLYQAQYALLRLWNETVDDAVIYLETLDDVTLESNGETILEQLKHSLSAKPANLTLTSVSVWKTFKAWIDVLPELDLSKTVLNLVTVADISPKSKLLDLLDDSADRTELLTELRHEAQRVHDERLEAKNKKEKDLPHELRAKACEAYLNLPHSKQAEILSRVRITPGQKNIRHIEDELAMKLTSVLSKDRAGIAQRLVEWWNRQIIHAHCGKRPKAIPRFELISQFIQIVADLEHDTLVDHFATKRPPGTYLSHPMVENQIGLVDASTWLERVVTSEWRARESRSRWATDNPTWRERIAQYDTRLIEEWGYKHEDMAGACSGLSDDIKKEKGRDLLSWSFYNAPRDIEAVAPSVTSPSYVRGTFQTLSIDGRVGWHPDYKALLGFKK
ncbi:ABC-three component system protein [Burkholderia cepacia]|uniref:ABC-three component system protein n=1 Tax=Burkholderia cepacia TaxID=292 RepID=UPI000F573139|nr:ABC-three component system protein [Burkholderia cepacia]